MNVECIEFLYILVYRIIQSQKIYRKLLVVKIYHLFSNVL